MNSFLQMYYVQNPKYVQQPPPPASMPRPGWGLNVNGWNRLMDGRVAGERPGKAVLGCWLCWVRDPHRPKRPVEPVQGLPDAVCVLQNTINNCLPVNLEKIWRGRGQF